MVIFAAGMDERSYHASTHLSQPQKYKPHIWTRPNFAIIMMTSSNGNIFRVTGPLWTMDPPHKGQWCGALVFYVRLHKRLSKQSRPQWFETPSRSSWRHCNYCDITLQNSKYIKFSSNIVNLSNWKDNEIGKNFRNAIHYLTSVIFLVQYQTTFD